MRRLVESWQQSGPSLTKMMLADVALLWKLKKMTWRAQWVPTSTPRAYLTLFPVIPKNMMKKCHDGKRRMTPEGEARMLFSRLTLNPEWDKLGGPCGRCAKYFIKNTARHRKYCTRQCGSFATAKASTRERLDQEHADKLRRAEAAARLWPRARTNLDWKLWVKQKEPDISPKWLTRAVNKGELQSPGNRSHQKQKQP